MSSVAEKTSVRARPAAPTVRLKGWPLRDEPLRSTAILALLMVVSLVSGVVTGSIALGLATFGLAGLTVWKMWLPVTYELGPKGLVLTSLGRRRRILWSDFARYEAFPDGVLLSSVAAREPVSSLHNLFVRFNGQREELLGALDFYIQSPPANAPSTTRTMTTPGTPIT